MQWPRDPRDRRYPERLTGSYIVSLVLHLLMAAFLFSILASSSNEGASESIPGGAIVTLERRTPVVAKAPAQTVQAVPVPNAPRIAPVQHPRSVLAATQPRPPQKHELSKFAPTAPPNPTPLPQASAQPNPIPTQAVYEPQPREELPAVPQAMPTAAVVATTIHTAPPTIAPSPLPTNAPTAKPSAKPVPTTAPTSKPATSPAPPSASAAPSAAPVVAKASPAPSASPAAAAVQSTAPPAPKSGVPSPSPTQGASQTTSTTGTNPSPGPKGQSSPGPKPGNSGINKAGTQRPVTVRPTAEPRSSSSGSNPVSNAIGNINDKLRGMLGNKPVVPNAGSYHPPVTLGNINPTPPPDVLAATKYIFEENASGDFDKMWVTGVRHDGPLTICEGWLVRYPVEPGTSSGGSGISITIGGARPRPGLMRPIVEGVTSVSCSMRKLTPFAPSPASSP